MSNYVPPNHNPAANGCTSCGSQDTTVLDPRHGRRCADCPPPFDREWALTLVDLGRASEAFAYLRATPRREGRRMNRCGTHLGYRDHQNNGTTTCQPCRDAQAAWQRDYEKRRVMAGARYVQRRHPLEGGHMLVDSTGTRRRLQALSVMGWRGVDLAERSGIQRRYLSELVARGRPMVSRQTAEKVAALYDELSMLPGPSPYVARLSRGKGWSAPLSWDDEDLDDPAAKPDARPFEPRRNYRDQEMEQRVLYLTRCGLSAAEIALRLSVNTRYVDRVRARYKAEGAA